MAMIGRMLFFLCLITGMASGQTAYNDLAQTPKDTVQPKVFELGEVTVVSEKSREINTIINADKLRSFAVNETSGALNLLPGVHLSAVGPRNEAMVYVRGFDLRQVPLLIDGIPVYIPYDGYVDLARFTTFDLAEIQVSKGYTSVVYGPNALGGAINLITRKPSEKFELNGAAGWLSGGYRTNINLGSKLEKFYVQAGVSQLKRDFFPLPRKLVSTRSEDGSRRDNSWNTDSKYNVRIAYTPNARSEYALSYIYQHGRKGSPVYAGNDTLNGLYAKPRFWQWPYWDKQSLYFISNTRIDSSQYIKTRFYYDKFKNQLNSYDDATYTTMSKPSAFKSFYNDYSIGGIAEYGRRLSTKDNLVATLQFKQDVHHEHDEGEPDRTMSDNTFTAGLENRLALTTELLLLSGLSVNNRASITAQDYDDNTGQIGDFPANNNTAVNIQGGLEYRPDAGNTFTFYVARKTRFATTKDRYSYRLGSALPNPDLHAEYAVNFDLGYKGQLHERLTVQADLFYSRINNTILMVSNVKYDPVRSVWMGQLQNVGRSVYEGFELGSVYRLLPSLNAGLDYTFIKRKNLTNPNLYFTDVPPHKLSGFLQYESERKLSMQVNAEYNSQRYSTSYGTVSGSFFLVNAAASVAVWKWFSVGAGIYNIFDRHYSLVEGYPEPGRNYFVNIGYHL